jgi:1-acyl-sn-glycerol-3-phosphate acyltransferase
MKDQTDGLPFPLKVVLDSIGYITYFLAIAGFLCIGLPVFLMFAAWPRVMRSIMYTVLKGYAFFLTRLWLPALQVYSVREIAGFNESALRGSIVVANHRSRLDALLMLSVLPHAGVVIKLKYARIPVYSTFVKHLDFVSIDPDSLQSLGSAVEKCRQVLAKGKSLLVFPEGTRATTGKLLPYKPFPFKVALETGAPVVPVLIYSDLALMARRKGSIFPRRRFSYAVRFLPPCRPEPGETAAAFAERVRRMMAGELALLDKGTLWDRGPKADDASGNL